MTSHAGLFILTFASPKGGVGKSTSCLTIAGALAAHGYPVHIVDLDQTQTLWNWYREHGSPAANLTVEAAPPQHTGIAFLQYLKGVCSGRHGFLLVDAAGSLTDIMVYAATIAHLTISPAKLSAPDIREAVRLHHRLVETSTQAGKGFIHRVLFNEVAALPPSYQTHALSQIMKSPLTRFETLMHIRAPYAEAFLTGQPPHFADRSRPPVRKAVDEADALLVEVFEALGINTQQKAAA